MTTWQDQFKHLPEGWETQEQVFGLFLNLALEKGTEAALDMPLGSFDAKRFTAMRRIMPWWMVPAWGGELKEVPLETQLLLLEQDDGVLVLAPLVDPRTGTRASLKGDSGGLSVRLTSGDPTLPVVGGCVLYAIHVEAGDVEGMRRAMAEVAHHMGVPLREEKDLPEFVDNFGWCTWDAFYKEVDEAKVMEGLQSFRDVGVEPRWMVLDDGWQPVAQLEGDTGEALTGLGANEKFEGASLSQVVHRAKSEFEIREFLVWHAFQGYWGGVHPQHLPEYGSKAVDHRFDEDLLVPFDFEEAAKSWFVEQCAPVDLESIDRFYHDYHRNLSTMGVDGVKVDNQASLEGVGQGGRVSAMARWHEALEGSVAVHFSGRLINCMSDNNDMLYQSKASNLTRASNDFFPKRTELHMEHVVVNALFGLWWGGLFTPDWDMFHSRHEWGHFHAVSRAISGGPIYVSDKPGYHEPELLSALTLADGLVSRCESPAVPGDWFMNPSSDEGALYTLVNEHDDCPLVAAFNGAYPGEGRKTWRAEGEVAPPRDWSIEGEQVVALRYGQTPCLLASGESLSLSLDVAEACLVAFVALDDERCVPLGLKEKLQPAGAIDRDASGWLDRNLYTVSCLDGGELWLWAAKAPEQVTVEGEKLSFYFNENWLEVGLSSRKGQRFEVELQF